MKQVTVKQHFAIALLLLVMCFPVVAQGDVDEPTPTIEAFTPTVEVVESAEGVTNWLDDVLAFIEDNNVLWMIVFSGALVIAGRNVSPEAIEKLRSDASKTETIVDDIAVKVLELLNARGLTPAPVGPSPAPSIQDELDRLKEAGGLPSTPALPVTKLPVGIPLVYFGHEKDVSGRPFYEETHNGRRVAIPAGYQYVGQPGVINGEVSPHCDVFYKDGGYEFALAEKAGRFPYEFTLKDWVLGQRSRYAIVVRYSHSFTPLVNKDGSPAVYIGGVLKSGGLVNVLEDRPVTAESSEAQWVIETLRDYRDLAVQVGVYLPWATVNKGGILKVEDVQFVPVADDYGGENVIRI